ncbi:hypothetical protein FRB97_002173 [Tulasnella sp. 331]|nr:hypothetical protein FRB97_002173 [Tulasnella sp. 331]
MSIHRSDSDEDPLLLISSSFRPNKRRRIEPLRDQEEVVETSDAEEREELAAAQPSYWASYVASRQPSNLGDSCDTSYWGKEAHMPPKATEGLAATPSPRRRGATQVVPVHDEAGRVCDLPSTPTLSTKLDHPNVPRRVNLTTSPPISGLTSNKIADSVFSSARDATPSQYVLTDPTINNHPTFSPTPLLPLITQRLLRGSSPAIHAYCDSSAQLTTPKRKSSPTAFQTISASPSNGDSPLTEPAGSPLLLSPSQTRRMDILLRSTRSPSLANPKALSLPELDALLQLERQPSLQLFTSEATPSPLCTNHVRDSVQRSSVGAPDIDCGSPTKGGALQQSQSQRRAQSDPPASSFSPHQQRRPQEHDSLATASRDKRASSPFILPPDLNYPARRNLRHRTAIQLNPYTREALMYKAILARAGAKEAFVRDVRVMAGVGDGHRRRDDGGAEIDADETQDWDGDGEEDEESQSPRRRRQKSSDVLDIVGSSTLKAPSRSVPTARQGVPLPSGQPAARQHLSAQPSSRRAPKSILPPRTQQVSKDAHQTDVAQALESLTSDDDEDDPITKMLREKEKTVTGASPATRASAVHPPKASMLRHRSSFTLTSSDTTPPSPMGSASSATAAPIVMSPLQSLHLPRRFGSSSPPMPPTRHRLNSGRPSDHSTAIVGQERTIDPIHVEGDTPPAKRERSPETTQDPDADDGDDGQIRSSESDDEDEDEGEDEDDERALRESKRDKKLRKTLVKVFPAFMVKMMEKDKQRQQQKKKQPHRRLSSDGDGDNPPLHDNSGEDSDEVRERSGRVRIVPNPRGRLEIQGDPESSDHEAGLAAPESPPFSAPWNGSDSGVIEPGDDEFNGWRSRSQDNDNVGIDSDSDPPHGRDDRIASSEESEEDDQEAGIGDFDVNCWLDHASPDPPLAVSVGGRHPPTITPREGDLIDRMLSRHVNISSIRRKLKFGGAGTKKRRRRQRDQPTLWEYQEQQQQQRPSKRRTHTTASKAKEPGPRPSTKIYVNVVRTSSPSSLHSRHQTHSRTGGRAEEGEQPLSITFRQPNAAVPSGAHQPIVISDDDDYPGVGGLGSQSSQPVQDFSHLLRPKQNRAVIATRPPSAASVSNHAPKSRPEGRSQTRQTREAEVRLQSYASALSHKRTRDGLIDLGLPCPPTGSAFSHATYLGSGRLVRLLSLLVSRIPGQRPDSVGPLHATMTLTDLEDGIPAMFDGIYEWRLKQPRQQRDENPSLPGTTVPGHMQFLCEYVSWSTSVQALSTPQDVTRFFTIVQEQVQHLIARLENATTSGSRPLQIEDSHMLYLHWFAVELSLRLWHSKSILNVTDGSVRGLLALTDALGPTSPARRYLHGLVSLLLDANFHEFRSHSAMNGDVPAVSNDLESTPAEVWICCMQVVEALEGRQDDISTILGDHPFWRHIIAVLNLPSAVNAVGLEASEKLWRSILVLNILSKFSSQGIAVVERCLPACWAVVQHAVSLVRLESDPLKDAKTMAAVLQKRDAYIRLVLARCLLLVTRWNWSLCGADALLKSLTAVFRTRRFENLRGEVSDFPAFLRDLDQDAFLTVYDKKETSFGIFLKLALHAAKDHRQDPRGSVFGQKQLRKLASLIFPIGTTPFTRENPPIGRDLSMLFNRLAAVVVVIHLEPTNAKLRVQQARRFLDFKNADANSRSAYIRGMMLIAIVHRRQELDMEEIMAWYADMVSILLQDLKDAELAAPATTATQPGNRRPEVAILVLQLVGALRKVIETMPSDGLQKYPNPIFLEQAFLDRIMASSLSDDVRTSLEMRKLIQAFLEARAKALGPRSVSEPKAVLQEERESQQSDEYGDWGVDWDDPRVLAALGEGQKTADMLMEERVAEVVKSTLSAAIFQFIQKHYGDTNNRTDRPVSPQCDDKWVECWVGCVDVLVQNNIKTWSQYQEWGDESLDRVVDISSRHAIEWRFLLTMLRVDPASYVRNQGWCLSVWLTALVTARLTREHEYTSMLLNADKMRNPLLCDLPFVADEDWKYTVTLQDVEEMRLPTLRAVTRNIVGLMRRTAQSPKEKQCIAVGMNGLAGALAEMKENCERATKIMDEPYLTLCRGFVEYLKTPACAVLWDESRISNAGNSCLLVVDERMRGDQGHVRV